MRAKLICFLCLCICCSFFGYAQQVVPLVKADSTNRRIGQPVKIQVQLSQPANAKVNWTETDSLDQMEILSKTGVDTVKTSDPSILLRSQTYQVTAFDSGAFYFKSMRFAWLPPGNKDSVIIYTDSLLLHFSLIPVDTTKEIKDIKPIVNVPYDYTLVLIIGGSVILLVLIAYILYRYFKKRAAQKPVITAPEIKRPAHEIALEKLEALGVEGVWQRGDAKQYHTRLTDIIREYIENRFGVNAMELTSDEILNHGFINLVAEQQREALAYSLRLADLVKFAKVQPLPDDHEKSMRDMIDFVNKTAQRQVQQDASVSSNSEL